MFVATEVSQPSPGLLLPFRVKALLRLRDHLASLEQYATYFQAAFPDRTAADAFITAFDTVLTMEHERDDAFTQPSEPNRLHHDAESIYWSLLWAVARAKPFGEAVVDAEYDSAFAKFCNVMLDHTPGEEIGRQLFIHTAATKVLALLHTRTQSVSSLFVDMATYLSVPWHLYINTGVVKPDHAHHALRRLILLHILSLRAGGQNLPFDRKQPRTFSPQEGRDQRVTSASQHGSGAPALRIPPPPRSSALRSKKRGRGDDEDGDDVPDATDDEDDPRDRSYVGKKTKSAHKVLDGLSPAAAVLEGSACDYVEKIRNDKMRWFGTGK